jgi:hypothetical protein
VKSVGFSFRICNRDQAIMAGRSGALMAISLLAVLFLSVAGLSIALALEESAPLVDVEGLGWAVD